MHGFANPARFLRLARWLTPLLFVSGVLVTVAALAWGLFVAPAEGLQGETVRIVYIHVPTAWLGMGGWTAIAVASLAELVWRHPLAGIAARAIGRTGCDIRRHLFGHRIAVGPAGLGHLVGVGRTPDFDAGAAVPLPWATSPWPVLPRAVAATG